MIWLNCGRSTPPDPFSTSAWLLASMRIAFGVKFWVVAGARRGRVNCWWG